MICTTDKEKLGSYNFSIHLRISNLSDEYFSFPKFKNPFPNLNLLLVLIQVIELLLQKMDTVSVTELMIQKFL